MERVLQLPKVIVGNNHVLISIFIDILCIIAVKQDILMISHFRMNGMEQPFKYASAVLQVPGPSLFLSGI